MQDKTFYTACLGFVIGVLLRSFIFVNFYFNFILILVSIALLFFAIFFTKNKLIIFFSIFILLFSFGILRFNLFSQSAPDVFKAEVDKKNSFSGIILDEPDKREDNQKLVVGLNIDNEKTKILITTDLENKFDYGDEINIYGTLDKPENFITDQGKNFDYINYLKKDGIFYVMRYPEIDVISIGNGNFIKSKLFFVKEKFFNKISLVVREPESLLLGGLILGEKSSFNESLRQSFVDTGTIHIVALSGYNVTIVAEWIMKLFSSFPMNMGIGAGILSIFLFVLMTGASSTAIRAGIMASLALLARLIGRDYDVARALIIAGILMILINPMILVFDVSFQLSFIATVAVIFYAPRIEKYFFFITDRFGLRDIVSVTCAAYVFVLPFILYKMGNLSLVALPANFLVLPFIPITMIFGFLTGVSGFISYFLSVLFGYFSYFFLHYELFIIGFLSHIPFASFNIQNFPLFLTILIYAYFIYFLFGRSIKSFFTKN